MEKILFRDTSLIFTDKSFKRAKSVFNKQNTHNFILCDENSFANCLPLLFAQIPFLEDSVIIQIPSGEKYKTLKTVKFIWEAMLAGNANRKSLLINVGGGVVTDIGGFCASTFMRGISFINIPTTLLAMVDASIGGKTGFDFKGIKNFIGTFSHPQAVIICPDFLETLPNRQLVSGFAEMIKHGLIYDKRHLMNLVKKGPLKLTLNEIAHSIRIKSDIVKKDFMENNHRKLLNFGHTIGHAIESLLLKRDNSLLHGEAIFIGMLLEAHLSLQKKLINKQKFSEIEKILTPYVYKNTIEESDIQALIKIIAYDKKRTHLSSNFTLIDDIGNGIINQSVTQGELTKALGYYFAFKK